MTTIIAGNKEILQQRPSTFELLIQLVNAGVELDPRSIRALTSADIVSAVQSGAWSVSIGSALPAGANRVGKVTLRNPLDTLDLGDSTNPLRIDPTGTTTQPVSASFLPLPAGASTAAKQPALGTAGVPSTDVISIQGVISGTVVPIGNPSNLDVALSTRLAEATFTGRINTQGQKTMAASTPVVIASDQSAVPVNQTQGTAGFQQPRKLVTYNASYRLAARPYALSFAMTLNSRKQYATIHHAATATKTVKLRHVWVAVESSSVAAIIMADLVRITTAPATGNPAITPAPANPGDVAAEAICLALPTTAATEGALQAFTEYNLGVTGAASAVNPPPSLNWFDLLTSGGGFDPDNESKLQTIRAGVLEGFAVILDSNAASTVKYYIIIEFTEE